MFKLVVLSAVLAVVAAAPRPGILHAAPAIAVAPVATSHAYRVDVHSAPIIAAAPVVAAAPVIAHAAPLALPAAVSHSSRYDIHRSAAIIAPAIAAPAVSIW